MQTACDEGPGSSTPDFYLFDKHHDAVQASYSLSNQHSNSGVQSYSYVCTLILAKTKCSYII